MDRTFRVTYQRLRVSDLSITECNVVTDVCAICKQYGFSAEAIAYAITYLDDNLLNYNRFQLHEPSDVTEDDPECGACAIGLLFEGALAVASATGDGARDLQLRVQRRGWVHRFPHASNLVEDYLTDYGVNPGEIAYAVELLTRRGIDGGTGCLPVEDDVLRAQAVVRLAFVQACEDAFAALQRGS